VPTAPSPTWPDLPESPPATAAAAPWQITIETAIWTNHTDCLERPANSRYNGFVGRVAYDGSEPQCSLQLLRNDSPKNGSWLQLRLVGTASNAVAIGAVVRVEVEGQTLMRQIVGGTGGHSQSSLVVHFGLGPTAMVDAVEVLWPSGLRTRWANQPANRLIEVVEDAGTWRRPRAWRSGPGLR